MDKFKRCNETLFHNVRPPSRKACINPKSLHQPDHPNADTLNSIALSLGSTPTLEPPYPHRYPHPLPLSLCR